MPAKAGKINKDNICKNIKIYDHDYKVRDNVIVTNKSAYRYETPYNGTFVITQCWTNIMVTLQCGPIEIRHNIRRIKPYISDTNIEYINPEKVCNDVNI